MRKILINSRAGGFDLSNDAIKAYLDAKGIKYTIQKDLMFNEPILIYYDENGDRITFDAVYYGLIRDDETLISVVEELGPEKASGASAALKIVEIPDDVEWDIGISDSGAEWVYEKHRTWE